MENSNTWTKKAKRKGKKNWAQDRKTEADRKRQRTERLALIDSGQIQPTEDSQWKPKQTDELANPSFDKYYQHVFKGVLNEAEFAQFRSTLVEKLPVTFRVNAGLLRHEKVTEMFSHPSFVTDFGCEQEKHAK